MQKHMHGISRVCNFLASVSLLERQFSTLPAYRIARAAVRTLMEKVHPPVIKPDTSIFFFFFLLSILKLLWLRMPLQEVAQKGPLHPPLEFPRVTFLHNFSALAHVENGHWYNPPDLLILVSPVLCALVCARVHVRI